MGEKKQGVFIEYFDGSKYFIDKKDFLREENGFLFYKKTTVDGRSQSVRLSSNPDQVKNITYLGDSLKVVDNNTDTK
jgi:hypothetical protein